MRLSRLSSLALAKTFSAAIFASVLLPACAEEEEPGNLPDTAATPRCGEAGNGFMLVGSVDGQTLNITHADMSGGFMQFGEGELTQPDEGDPDRQTLTHVALKWKKGISDGQTGNGTGEIKLGADSPDPGRRLCSANVKIHMRTDAEEAKYGTVTYILDDLMTGPNCDEPIDGQLVGCMD
jgi:hypothetical protein